MADERIPYASDEGEDTVPTPPEASKKPPSNVPVLIALAVLVVIVVWGLAHLATLARPWFSSLIPKQQPPPSYPTAVVSNAPAPIPAAPAHSAKPVAYASAPATPPDLSVHILDIGVIDPATGNFISRAPASPADITVVRFDIANDGDSPTSAWYFSASLPVSPSVYAYQSPVQEPLGPGDHIVNTLRFSQVVSGGGIFGVIVDPQGAVRESNEANNTATIFIPMPVYY